MRQAVVGDICELILEGGVVRIHPADDLDIVRHGIVHVVADGAHRHPLVDPVGNGRQFRLVVGVPSLDEACLLGRGIAKVSSDIVVKILQVGVHHEPEAQPVGDGTVQLAHVVGAEAGLVRDYPGIGLHEGGSEVVFEIVLLRLVPEPAQRAAVSR